MSQIKIKDSYYFSHDANAKDDYKCMLLIDEMGPEGYGIFWVLVETLREQKNYRYPVQLIPSLARKYNTSAPKMETVIRSYGLFEVEEKEFFSNSLNRRMALFEAQRKLKIESGQKGGQKSAQKRKEIKENQVLELSVDNSTQASLEHRSSDAQASKEKEKKEKEKKLNKIPEKEERGKSRLDLAPEVEEFRQKLINSGYVGQLAPVMVEMLRENVYLDSNGLLYSDSRNTQQIVTSTLNEIWTELFEIHENRKNSKKYNIKDEK